MHIPELHFFGADARLHHAGLAVKSIAALRLPGITITHDPVQKVNVAFARIGDACVELIEPAAESSPVSASLARGVKLLHLCYEVADLAAALEFAKNTGLKVIQNPVPAEAFGGRKIAWVYHPAWGLFELLER